MKKRWSEKEAAWQVEEGGEVPAGRPLGVGPAGGAGPGVASHSPSLQAPPPAGQTEPAPPGRAGVPGGATSPRAEGSLLAAPPR